MASVLYLRGINTLLAAFSGLDVRAALLMTNTTADTENTGLTYVSDITTLDECDDTGYARIALTSEANNVDVGNVRVELDAADLTFSGLSGNATRDAQGLLLYRHVTNDTDSPVIAFLDFVADIPSTATQITVPFNAEGIIQFAAA